MFCEVGAKAGRHAGHSVGKLAIAKVQVGINKQNGLERIKCKKEFKEFKEFKSGFYFPFKNLRTASSL
jgi:hypothetical protein